MSFTSRFNAVGGLQDFWTEFKRPNPHRLPILAVSVLLPLGLLYILSQQRSYIEPQPPVVTYITTFAADRSDEEIRASNIANQERKERLAAEQAERDEKVREIYRSLGRATGIDVDAMDAEIAREKAAEEAAAEARFGAGNAAADTPADNRNEAPGETPSETPAETRTPAAGVTNAASGAEPGERE
jgi:uncharacterized protein (UPF0335 family)